jgi:hypothetical protein
MTPHNAFALKKIHFTKSGEQLSTPAGWIGQEAASTPTRQLSVPPWDSSLLSNHFL